MPPPGRHVLLPFLFPEGVMRPALALASLSLIFLTGAVASPKPPSIEGTYRLVSRDFPDGSKQVPPAGNGQGRLRHLRGQLGASSVGVAAGATRIGRNVTAS